MDNDERAMHISGNYYLMGHREKHYSRYYYFSRYPLIWGWPTWRRAWNYYDFKAKRLREFIEDRWLEKLLDDERASYVWKRNFQGLYDNYYTCDYQWILACWIQASTRNSSYCQSCHKYWFRK